MLGARAHQVLIRLNPHEHARVQEIAREVQRALEEQGLYLDIGPSVLMRSWVLHELGGPCESHTTEEVVYFVRRSDGLIKIGHTTAPKERLGAIRSMCGPIEVLHTMRGTRSDEQALHDRFDYCRAKPKGEWFKPDVGLLSCINALQGQLV